MRVGRVVAILPTGPLFDPIYAGAIEPALAEKANEVIRVQPEFSSPGALGRICGELERAELVLADISARNPHVMFLAGYAQGIGREVLYLVQHGEDFPFHQPKYAPIIYGNNLEFLKGELIQRFREEGTTGETKQKDAREQFLEIFGDLLKKHGHEHRGEIQLENATTYVLLDQDMELALVQDLARRGRELGIRIKLM